MKYKFYQRLLPFNKLIDVGEYDVPDGHDRWHIPVEREIRAHINYDPTTTMDRTNFEEHVYYKKAIGFIADVTSKLT